MKAEKARASDSDLRTLWGIAEEEGVRFGTDMSASYKETGDQAAMYDIFLYFGDVYRENVIHNDDAYILGLAVGSDPRKDRRAVRRWARVMEGVYSAAVSLP